MWVEINQARHSSRGSIIDFTNSTFIACIDIEDELDEDFFNCFSGDD